MPTDESRRHETRAAFAVRTGTTPAQFVLDALAESSGRLCQRTLVERSGLTESAVCCVLADLEDRGRITRVRVGGRNLVFLPEHAPDSLDD
ncbi:helix-turn-helix transcriptional regulator [Halarchaeum sp. P4]|uniref:helix-turn-helix transcriptional regulator n=1 Tax=Halarchaeum sp. P4 TaxID=3421639 RepID=UPI003EBB6F9F